MFCTNCGKEVADNVAICINCGFPPRQEKNYCGYCGVKVAPRQVVCVKCGMSLNHNGGPGCRPDGAAKPSGEKSRIAAALFALFLGGLGIHKFYYLSWVWGLVYLGFFFITCSWGGVITSLLAIVEAIRFFVMSDEDFEQKYNHTPASPFRW